MMLFAKDLSRDVAVVAEIGVNHEGDVLVAEQLVRDCAAAGSDAVKFQSYTPERYASASDPARLARVTKFALSVDDHRRLAAVAAESGISFFSTPLSEDWVPLLAELSPAIKIASGDLTFEPVVRAAARTGKPVVLSTGLGTVDEIDRAVSWVADEVLARGDGATLADRLVLLHCVVAYPTPIEETNLATIGWLRDRYRVEVGWSNHVIGTDACVAALALGASVLEVHVTDRRGEREFRDHAMSFLPAELAALVELAPKVRAAVGVRDKVIAASEAGNRLAVRKGVVAARDLEAGTVLQQDDLMYARPATEFAAGSIGDVVGRTLSQSLGRGEMIGAAVLTVDVSEQRTGAA
ncbi:MAG: N-acetylneuraminate synthase family protein [Acidimicrobiia bacterium]